MAVSYTCKECGLEYDSISPRDAVQALRSFPRRYRKAKQVYPDVLRIDAHMMVQADEHRGTPPAELRTTFESNSTG